jgi:hypothetical protein
MSFQTDLYSLIAGNSTLNAAVSGVYYQNLPDNYNPSLNCIVYITNLIDSIDSLTINNHIDIYELKFIVFSPSTKSIDDITAIIRSSYDNYEGGKFRDFHLNGSEIAEDFEREQYISTYTYKIHYEN